MVRTSITHHLRIDDLHLGSGRLGSTRPVKPPLLSITHKSGIERGAYSDIGQSGEAAPHDRVAWWRIAGLREIAAEPRDLGQIERERLLMFWHRCLSGTSWSTKRSSTSVRAMPGAVVRADSVIWERA